MGQTQPYHQNPEAFDPRVEDLRVALDLPHEAKFTGFVILNLELEEFLHESTDSAEKSIRAFSSVPQQAYKFKKYSEAKQLARAEQGESVAAIFDLGEQLLVAQVADEMPIHGETIH